MLLAAGLPGCGGGGGGSAPDPAGELQVGLLSSGTYVGPGGGSYPFQRLRLSRPNGTPTYAIWFPAPGSSASARAAAVLLSDPYGGIDWSGEAIDTDTFARVGHRGFQMIEDIHGPLQDPTLPTFVPYDYSELDDAGGGALAYLMNGISVVVSYQRAYAGGSFQNDVDDALAALAFLRTQANVDPARIGIWGSSYGGAVALHASARAPSSYRPLFGALSTPIVDWKLFVEYADYMRYNHSDPGMATLRLDPFRRRALAAATGAGGAVDFTPYATPALAASLVTKFLFVHDSFDTIAPMYTANELYFGTPGRHQAFVYPHLDRVLDLTRLEVTHAPVQPGFDEPSAILFCQAYLLTRLANSARGELLLPRFPGFDASLFAYLREQGRLGFDLPFFLRPRLLELCDARIRIFDFAQDVAAAIPGRRFVAQLLNTYWQAGVDETGVVAWLQNNPL